MESAIDNKKEREKLENLYCSLGRMIVDFQKVEAAMLLVAASLLSLQDQKMCEIVFHRCSFNNLTLTLEALMAHKEETNPSKVEEFSELMKRIRNAEKQRNQLVHSVWEQYPDKHGRFRRRKSTIKRGKIKSFDKVSARVAPKEIEDLNKELSYIVDHLTTYIDDSTLDAILRQQV